MRCCVRRYPSQPSHALARRARKLAADDKSIALDVRVNFASGDQVDIERQSQRRPALLERVLYYCARLYANDEPNLALWAKFLTAATDEELQELAMQHPVLREAKEALDELSADPDARLRAEQREMALLSYQLDMGKMWHDGIAEGEAKGEARGRANALIAVLEARNLHSTAEQRERVEDCRDLALLERWLLRALRASSVDDVLDG